MILQPDVLHVTESHVPAMVPTLRGVGLRPFALPLVVARDLSNDGIRCNTILPGIFDTPLLARAPDNVKAALAASVPFPKRLGRPEEYAQVAHIASVLGITRK